MLDLLNPINIAKYFRTGRRFYKDNCYIASRNSEEIEQNKAHSRTKVINFLLSSLNRTTTYLEIGVRNPADNYQHIKSDLKYSVDPGVEFKTNPVDFKMTSDEFFRLLADGKLLNKSIKFDVIFIDGLHLAQQVDRDIRNAMKYIHEDGFIVLHDCNPPTEWHARHTYEYLLSPARWSWNGTTWKAFQKWRFDPNVYSCCIDTDFGVGILSKSRQIGNSVQNCNPFFEYTELTKNRVEALNLISFETLQKSVN